MPNSTHIHARLIADTSDEGMQPLEDMTYRVHNLYCSTEYSMGTVSQGHQKQWGPQCSVQDLFLFVKQKMTPHVHQLERH